MKTPPSILKNIAVAFLLNLLGLSPLHSSIVVLADNFDDGSFSGNTLTPTWTSSQPGTNPWTVAGTEQAVLASGGTSNDAFIINFGASSGTSHNTASNAYVITNGVFDLSFDIKFNSSIVGGTNRFYVSLRDSTNNSYGYRFYLANGTNANSYLCRLDSSEANLDTTYDATSYTFSTTNYTTVRFTKDTNGLIQVYINGTVYFHATDTTYNTFDTLNLVTRANSAAEIQYFDNIMLTTIPENSTLLMLVWGLIPLLILIFLRKNLIPFHFRKCALITSLCITCFSFHGYAQVLVNENFDDGDFHAFSVEYPNSWSFTNSSYPWTVSGTEKAAIASGSVSFDTLSTTFSSASIAGSNLSLSFDIKLNSATLNGSNRFYFRLVNSITNSGYGAYIANGTGNNSYLFRINGGSETTIDSDLNSTAYTFSTSTYTTVQFIINTAGLLTVYVNGQNYFSATDTTYTTFDTLKLSTRGTTVDTNSDGIADDIQTHYFDNIQMSISIPESNTQLMLSIGGIIMLVIALAQKIKIRLRKLSSISLCCIIGIVTIAHAEVPVISDDFADGDYTQNPKWVPMKANSPWKIVDGAVVASGNIGFDTLSTTDFAAITDGVFYLKVDVKFTSNDKSGNNRFFLRLRNSKTSSSSENPGYEVVIAQGTNNNSFLGILGGVALDGKIKSAPYEFPLDKFTTVEWSRAVDGTMKVTVNGNLYFEAKDNQFQNLNQLAIGTRAYVPPGEPSSKAMVHIFDHVVLKK